MIIIKMPFYVTDSMINNEHKQISIHADVYSFINTAVSGSYNILFARLYGLSYAEFLRMARDEFGATLHGKDGGYITMTFANPLDAKRLDFQLTKKWLDITGYNNYNSIVKEMRNK